MSGGSFDYNCFRITSFAGDLKDKIEENEVKDNCGYCQNFNKETIVKLKKCQKLIKQAGDLAYAIEWLYSSDIGEASFCKKYNEIIKKGDE